MIQRNFSYLFVEVTNNWELVLFDSIDTVSDSCLLEGYSDDDGLSHCGCLLRK